MALHRQGKRSVLAFTLDEEGGGGGGLGETCTCVRACTAMRQREFYGTRLPSAVRMCCAAPWPMPVCACMWMREKGGLAGGGWTECGLRCVYVKTKTPPSFLLLLLPVM